MSITTIARMCLILALFAGLAGCAARPAQEASPPAAPSPGPTALLAAPATPQSARVRPAAFAGTWYPGDAETLRRTVDAMLAEAQPVDGAPLGLIVPHAGYLYSGQVAAMGFQQLTRGTYDVAVIVAADHAPPISNPVAVYPAGGFQTPLGVVEVDADLAAALMAADPRIVADPDAHEGEHVIEIELPFLQRVCPGCRIVPVLIGTEDETVIRALGDALARTLAGRRGVLIASTDLSHYPSDVDALAVDGETLSAIETGDPTAVRRAIAANMKKKIPNLLTCACSESAVLAVMHAAQQLGAETVTVLGYANSGDVAARDKTQVVGYGAVMLWHYEPPQLSTEQRIALLQMARSAIAGYLQEGRTPVVSVTDPVLLRPAAAFVTLTRGGQLRGCIGHMRADLPLYRVVQEMAVAAAVSDVRFPKLTSAELEQMRVEISVLSPLRRLTDVNAIQVGTHGLLIAKDGRQGVLLPQVPVQEGWNREAFLENLCLKAGLARGCWQEGAHLYSFTAIVFGEDEP